MAGGKADAAQRIGPLRRLGGVAQGQVDRWFVAERSRRPGGGGGAPRGAPAAGIGFGQGRHVGQGSAFAQQSRQDGMGQPARPALGQRQCRRDDGVRWGAEEKVPGQPDAQRHASAGVGRQRPGRRRIDQRVKVDQPAQHPAGKAPCQRAVVGPVDAVEGVGERAVERLALRQHRRQQAQRRASGGCAGRINGGQGRSRGQVIGRA